MVLAWEVTPCLFASYQSLLMLFSGTVVMKLRFETCGGSLVLTWATNDLFFSLMVASIFKHKSEPC